MKDIQEVNDKTRRDFLKSGAATLAGAFCFSAGLKDALAFAKAAGKPILTQDTLNEFFKQSHGAKQIKTLAKKIINNPVSWLKDEFALTKMQINVLGSIPSSEWSKIKDVLKVVEEKGVSLRVQLKQTDDGKPSAVAMSFVSGKCKGSASVNAEGSYSSSSGGNVTVKASATIYF
ncbi:MAG: hypothetical protein ACT4O9_10490 [Blastocatellia bacterium]